MPKVMNPARIASSDSAEMIEIGYGLWYVYLQNDFVFNLILSFSTCSQSLKKNLYVGGLGRERP